MVMTEWIYYILLILMGLCGLFVTLLGLPGLWLMVAAYAGYAWLTRWDVYIGWPSMIALLVLAALAEVVEFFAGAAGSKAAGGRKRGMFGAVVGAVIGGIVLSPVFPVVGTIFGACLGAFIGAAVLEFYDRDARHAFRVGMGAARGRFYGIISKLAFGMAMFIILVIAALPL
jgi:uncharacterized protein YqgC (DUF456 family)